MFRCRRSKVKSYYFLNIGRKTLSLLAKRSCLEKKFNYVVLHVLSSKRRWRHSGFKKVYIVMHIFLSLTWSQDEKKIFLHKTVYRDLDLLSNCICDNRCFYDKWSDVFTMYNAHICVPTIAVYTIDKQFQRILMNRKNKLE